MMSLLEESQNGIVNMTAEDNDAIIELRFKSNELKKQLMVAIYHLFDITVIVFFNFD